MLRKLALWLVVVPVLVATLDAEAAIEHALSGGGRVHYLEPLREVERPPLLVFVEGRFWGLRPEQAPPLEAQFARPLRLEGVAVALLQHRPAPAVDPKAYAQDVAEGVAWIVSEADRLGFDPARVVLAGHGSGGQLAALVALDASYLAAHDLAPGVLRAVAPISALYDLESSKDVPKELFEYVARAYPSRSSRRQASPLRVARPTAVPLVALAAGADIPGLSHAGNAFTEALRAAGHANSEFFVAGGRDHFSVLGLGDERNNARDQIFALLGVGDRVAMTRETWDVRKYWRAPALSTAGFWQHEDLIETREPQPALDVWVNRYFASGGRGGVGGVNLPWHAIDLEAWLERSGRASAATRRWLVLTNARGEQAVLDREAVRAYRPVIVVGIGDEQNLFRIVDVYHTLRRTTWQQPEAERWLLARPLGGFVFFLEPPPPELVPTAFGFFALTPESFAVRAADPLAPVREAAADPALSQLLISDKACVSCHQVGGAGGRAGHLRATDGELVGGIAQALEDFPAEVWRRYIYDQLNVAAEIGASPAVLLPEQRGLLYRGIVRLREAR